MSKQTTTVEIKLTVSLSPLSQKTAKARGMDTDPDNDERMFAFGHLSEPEELAAALEEQIDIDDLNHDLEVKVTSMTFTPIGIIEDGR